MSRALDVVTLTGEEYDDLMECKEMVTSLLAQLSAAKDRIAELTPVAGTDWRETMQRMLTRMEETDRWPAICDEARAVRPVRTSAGLAVERRMKTCSECRQEKPEAEYRKHSTGHTMRYCNACHLAKRRAQHAEKREERNAQFRARYAANANGLRDKYAAVRKAKYAQEGRAALVAWVAANPAKAADAQRKKMKRGRDRLSDYYVRRLLTHPERSTVREVPAVLIECKRLQLMIERECREKR